MSIVSEQEFDGIIRSVCEVYRITPELLLGRKRWQPVAEARQMAMTILSHRGLSSTRAGQLFKRDHGTILHAVKATTDRLQVDRHARARWKMLKHLAVEPLPGQEGLK